MLNLRTALLRTICILGLLASTVESLKAQTPFPTLFGGPIGDPAFANERPIHVVVGGGVAVPASRFKDRHDLGFHGDVAVVLGKRGLPVRLRPEASYLTFRMNQQTAPIRNLDELRNTRLITGIGNIEVSLYKGFYALAGAGAMRTMAESPNDSLPDAKATSSLFNAGFGFRFAFARVAGFFEGRVITSAIDEQTFGYSRVQMMPLTFGFVF